MNKTLDPDQVFESFTKKKISKEEALNYLITVLEKSENFKLRINSLRIIGKISHKNERIFRILENCLISDEIQEIRALSSEIILNQYLQEGLNTLKWAIMNENSTQVLCHFKSILNKNMIESYSILKNALDLRMKTIASKFNVNIEEVQFLLDIGIQLRTNTLFKMDDQLYYIYRENLMCVIKNNHIKEINLTSYPKIPNSIGNLKSLETLNFSCNNFYELPIEFEKLTNLKNLDLSWNEFKEIPDELNNLSSLQELNISNNFITEVPEWISTLENLVYLNIKGNEIKYIPDSIKSKKIKFLY
ncbi:MAG: leucine-rich repeat domain-containing protein [Promethearchaeota archaeon]